MNHRWLVEDFINLYVYSEDNGFCIHRFITWPLFIIASFCLTTKVGLATQNLKTLHSECYFIFFEIRNHEIHEIITLFPAGCKDCLRPLSLLCNPQLQSRCQTHSDIYICQSCRSKSSYYDEIVVKIYTEGWAKDLLTIYVNNDNEDFIILKKTTLNFEPWKCQLPMVPGQFLKVLPCGHKVHLICDLKKYYLEINVARRCPYCSWDY